MSGYLTNQKTRTLLCALLFTSAFGPADAQTAPSVPTRVAVVAPSTTPASLALPDNVKMTLLIHLHIAALSLANITGNYDTFRAMGSPKFQAAHTSETLAETFKTFRAKSIDISPALLFSPILDGPPRLEGADTLRLTGRYETEPQNISFDLAFQAVNNAWRLAGISVQTLPPRPVLAQIPAQPDLRTPMYKAPSAAKISSAPKEK